VPGKNTKVAEENLDPPVFKENEGSRGNKVSGIKRKNINSIHYIHSKQKEISS